MATLYLIHQTGGQVLTFTPQSEGHTWQMTRMPPQQLSKVHIIMCFGEHGWQIKEGGAKIAADMPLTEQDPKQPPLGTWRSVTSGHAWTGTWILQDSKPESAPLPVWEPIVTPSISLQCRMEEASLVRVDLSLRSQPLTDQLVEEVFKAMRLGVQELAKRPDMTMVFSLHLQDAPIPSMRHVKRLLALSHEIGDLLFLVARGSAMVLHPHGFLGRGMVSIVRFIQAAAAAPWPETIVPSIQEADAFLEGLRSSCLTPQSGASSSSESTFLPQSESSSSVATQSSLKDASPGNVESDLPSQERKVGNVACSAFSKPPGSLAELEQDSDDLDVDGWVPSERHEGSGNLVMELTEMPPPSNKRRSRSMFTWLQCIECV